ncbi:hypothetical protein B0H14DRAFT_223902 [Mycena olivaceomarginata]|nr:hypothetical protein B0H14DRAFT_223902 [Mycena olivaceomarginata]
MGSTSVLIAYSFRLWALVYSQRPLSDLLRASVGLNSNATARTAHANSTYATFPPSHFTPPLPPLHMPGLSTMRRSRSTRVLSDVVTATRVTLNAIQVSTDAFPPLKSVVSAVIVLLEMSEKIKSNREGCERIAQRSAQLVQDIWRQIKDFDVVLPAEVKRSVVEIEELLQRIKIFFDGLQEENVWQRLARQDRNKSQIDEYGKSLDEAISDFSVNLQLSIYRLHVESATTDEKRHDAVLAVSQMSETERLQLLTQIQGKAVFVPVQWLSLTIYMGKVHVHGLQLFFF